MASAVCMTPQPFEWAAWWRRDGSKRLMPARREMQLLGFKTRPLLDVAVWASGGFQLADLPEPMAAHVLTAQRQMLAEMERAQLSGPKYKSLEKGGQ